MCMRRSQVNRIFQFYDVILKERTTHDAWAHKADRSFMFPLPWGHPDNIPVCPMVPIEYEFPIFMLKINRMRK